MVVVLLVEIEDRNPEEEAVDLLLLLLSDPTSDQAADLASSVHQNRSSTPTELKRFWEVVEDEGLIRSAAAAEEEVVSTTKCSRTIPSSREQV